METSVRGKRYSAGMGHRKGARIALTFLVFAAAGATQQPAASEQSSASQSTVEALHALVHAGKITELMASVDRLATAGPDWNRVLEILLEAAEGKGDYNYLKRKAKQVFEQSKDTETRAMAAFALGTACWKSGEFPQAEVAFGEVGQTLPGSELAQAAAGNIRELKYLKIGQPAPGFAVQTTAGTPLNSDDLKGKVVLLNFWASWEYQA
jgi:hypothetical protein